MSPVDRLGRVLARAGADREALLVGYLTLADPVTSGVVPALAGAGVDVLELGLPTPSVAPRGAEIGRSFDRAGSVAPDRMWRRLAELRAGVSETPVILLVYPETVIDIGWATLLARSAESGVDGLVLTEPTVANLSQITDVGLSAIPLIRPTSDPDAAREWEAAATHLSYRNLGSRTGEPLDEESLGRVAHLAESAAKPFMVGFGVRYAREIRLLARHAAGVVVGSALLRRIATEEPADRVSAAVALVRRWKAATRTV